jgi:hypothetical protein
LFLLLHGGGAKRRAFAMSVQDLVILIREKVLPQKERPDFYWTGLMTAILIVLNFLLMLYFMFSESFLRAF